MYRTLESNQKARVAWRVNQHSQTLHPENPETGYKAMCRLAAKPVPLGGSTSETQNSPKMMSRLTSDEYPPGSFWKIPENAKMHKEVEYIHSIDHTFHAINNTKMQSTVPAPLT